MRVLVYLPTGKTHYVDNDWLYGGDIVRGLMDKHKDWEWLVCDGTTPARWFYQNKRPDVLLRPTRHDGPCMMRLECEALGIPVIWSYDTGRYKEPNVIDIEQKLIRISENL